MTVAHDATAGRLSIVSEGVTLATETLLLGQTTKVGTGRGDLIGQFGEGMKLGLLALVRAGHAVSITNGADRWAPAIVDSPTFGVKVLAVDVTPGAAVTRRQVRIDVDGITTATWAEYRERFLFLAKPAASERTATAAGDLLTADRFRGRLYVKGIYVQTQADLKHGYNFNDAETDRDRKMIGSYDRDLRIARIWAVATTKAPRLFSTFMELLEDEAPDVHGVNAYTDLSSELSEKVAGKFRGKYGRNAVPVANLAEAKDIEHLGKRGVVLPAALRAVLSKTIGDLDAVKQELSTEVIKTHSWSGLRPAARRNLEQALALVNDAGTPVDLADVSVVEYRSADLRGTYCGGHITLALAVVESASECLRVLVHEAAHRHGDDGDKGHVNAIEELWAAIVMRQLTAAATAAPAPTPTAPCPVKRPTSPTTQWGRVGTAAECYKRLLTSVTYTTPDAEIHAQVTAEIGAGKAGPLSYVGWYRNWLLKRGHALPGAPVATAEVAS
jgi:hypothetical protein